MEWNQDSIIKACIQGDEQAQLELFRKYRGQFFGLCMRYVNDKQVAEEVMMDAFLAIYKHIKKFKGQSFEAWMKSIVVHKAIDYFRKHKSDPIFDESDFVLERQKSSCPVSEIETDYLFQLIHCLPAGYKMVFNLYVIEGYQHNEIAEKLNISVNTSKTQLHKAKQRLQILLEKGGYHG